MAARQLPPETTIWQCKPMVWSTLWYQYLQGYGLICRRSSSSEQVCYHFPTSPKYLLNERSATSLSFSQGFLLGQLSIALLIFCFIKFFIFGEPPPADERAIHLSSLRRQRTLAHQRSQSNSLRRKASTILRNPPGPLSTASILAKTYYNIHGHQPESLDWFNVLIAQTIAQLRADARHDDAILKSLTKVINGPNKPDFVGEIRVTEIALGDEFPIFSNCRVIPVEEGGLFDGAGAEGGRLQARMDVDLSDVLTLGIETTLVLNYPKPRVAVLPVALAVSVVRFSGTVCLLRAIMKRNIDVRYVLTVSPTARYIFPSIYSSISNHFQCRRTTKLLGQPVLPTNNTCIHLLRRLSPRFINTFPRGLTISPTRRS